MSEVIQGQVRFLLMTALLGMALMGAYDILRFLRWLVPHHAVAVFFGDILFWVAASLPAYALFFVYNEGEIRWYGGLAVFLGGLLYEQGISLPLRRLGNRCFSGPRRRFIRWLQRGRRKGWEAAKREGRKLAGVLPRGRGRKQEEGTQEKTDGERRRGKRKNAQKTDGKEKKIRKISQKLLQKKRK